MRRLEPGCALVECFGADSRCVLTGGCGLERALELAVQAFFAEPERDSLADLADASPALAALPMRQPMTWKPPAAAKKARRQAPRLHAGERLAQRGFLVLLC